MNDDELGTLLRDTFTAHEKFADQDRAVVLARTPARRSRPVTVTLAAIAAAAAIVLGTAFVATRDGSDQSVGPAPSTTPIDSPTGIDDATRVRRQDIANQTEAAALARELLDLVPSAPGATRLDHSPTARLDEAAYGAPHTSTFTETDTTWWTVAGSADEVLAFYRTHPPTGMRRTGGWPSPRSRFAEFIGEDSATLEPAFMVIEVVKIGDSVAVRADSFVTPRPTRSSASYLGDNVASVEVVTLLNGVRALSVVITDADELNRVKGLVNALPGVHTPTFGMVCTHAGDVYRFVLHFHTPDHKLTVDQLDCGRGFDVMLDDQAFPPSLGYTQDIRDWLNALPR